MKKNFFPEFKKFINRGNVIDLAVGVIVGSAFTAIVNGLSNHILKPVIIFLHCGFEEQKRTPPPQLSKSAKTVPCVLRQGLEPWTP